MIKLLNFKKTSALPQVINTKKENKKENFNSNLRTLRKDTFELRNYKAKDLAFAGKTKNLDDLIAKADRLKDLKPKYIELIGNGFKSKVQSEVARAEVATVKIGKNGNDDIYDELAKNIIQPLLRSENQEEQDRGVIIINKIGTLPPNSKLILSSEDFVKIGKNGSGEIYDKLAAEVIKPLLQNEHKRVQFEGINIINEIGALPPSNQDILIPSLTGASSRVAAKAVKALGNIGKKNPNITTLINMQNFIIDEPNLKKKPEVTLAAISAIREIIKEHPDSDKFDESIKLIPSRLETLANRTKSGYREATNPDDKIKLGAFLWQTLEEAKACREDIPLLNRKETSDSLDKLLTGVLSNESVAETLGQHAEEAAAAAAEVSQQAEDRVRNLGIRDIFIGEEHETRQPGEGSSRRDVE